MAEHEQDPEGAQALAAEDEVWTADPDTIADRYSERHTRKATT